MIKVLPHELLQVPHRLLLSLRVQLGYPQNSIYLTVHINKQPVDPFSVLEVGVRLDHLLGEVDVLKLVEPAASLAVVLADLTELCSQDVYQVSQG